MVEPASKNSPLANPTAAGSYPIVGTSNWLMYTCYRGDTVRAKIVGFQNFYNSSGLIVNDTSGLLVKAGFSPLPASWRTAIRNTFLSSSSDATALNLRIRTAGFGHCSGKFGA